MVSVIPGGGLRGLVPCRRIPVGLSKGGMGVSSFKDAVKLQNMYVYIMTVFN